MIGIFKQKNPANIFLLLLFGILIKLPMFVHPYTPVVNGKEAVLYKAILAFLSASGKGNPFIYALLSYFLLFLQAVLLNRFINNQRMMIRSSFFPGMAFMLVTSLFPEWNYFSAPLIVNTILLLLLTGMFTIYSHENAKGRIFNAGLVLGIASFIFFPALSFLLWVLLALMVMRPFRINEWILCIIGVATPFYFYAVYLFITDQWNWQELLPNFQISLPSIQQTAWLAGSVFLLTIPFLSGGYYVQDSLRRMLIQVRKGWSLILLYLLAAIIVPFMNNSNSFENWVMAAIPFAAFHACTYLYAKQKMLITALFWITVAFILCYQYTGPGW